MNLLAPSEHHDFSVVPLAVHDESVDCNVFEIEYLSLGTSDSDHSSNVQEFRLTYLRRCTPVSDSDGEYPK